LILILFRLMMYVRINSYQRGDTTGTFQFESDGMQNYLRGLKPDKFEDLIAMNALYRPGPMEYIPAFIARKAWPRTYQVRFACDGRIPERHVWHYGLSGAGDVAFAEVGKLFER
jgi:hypothetical protein